MVGLSEMLSHGLIHFTPTEHHRCTVGLWTGRTHPGSYGERQLNATHMLRSCCGSRHWIYAGPSGSGKAAGQALQAVVVVLGYLGRDLRVR